MESREEKDISHEGEIMELAIPDDEKEDSMDEGEEEI